MSTFLFDTVIFGPVWSRRLGESLGINLLPAGRKVCNFNCIYCECGLTPLEDKTIPNFLQLKRLRDLLDAKLQKMKENGDYLDSITFAGNGEPTLHPEFPEIMEETIKMQKSVFPGCKNCCSFQCNPDRGKETFSMPSSKLILIFLSWIRQLKKR